MHPVGGSFLLLSTCNRTEVYFVSDDLAETHSYLLAILRQEIGEEFDQKLYSYFGSDCFFHLAQVTAGMDSAIVGETEIQGQVKEAYESARQVVDLPWEMHFLFQKCLGIGKRVRTAYPLQGDGRRLELAVSALAEEYFGGLKGASCLVIGASLVNAKIVELFTKAPLQDIAICNRTEERARAFQGRYGCKLLHWSERARWTEWNLVIVATTSPEYLLLKNDLRDVACTKRLVVDLSVPRNVDPEVALVPGVNLVDIDGIDQLVGEERCTTHAMISSARKMTLLEAERHVEAFFDKSKLRLAYSA